MSHRSAAGQTRALGGSRRRLLPAVIVLVSLALVAMGATGMFQYIRTYWLYRGFSAPSLPVVAVVHHGAHRETVKVLAGTEQVIYVRSAALGERTEAVTVYLPPGYLQHPAERYPVFYMLHGSPGAPVNFTQILDMDYLEDVLIAEHLMRPMILVAPTGTPSVFADTEWANSPRPDNDWETYVAIEVVNTIDHRYRTIPNGSERAIGGLSEGGYGALNIALHHPGEFRVIESWSGYMIADPTVREAWGGHPTPSLLAYNSPAILIRTMVPTLLHDHTFIWFYCGLSDSLVAENRSFAGELTALGLPFEFQVRPGSHTWVLWRAMSGEALMAASEHVARA